MKGQNIKYNRPELSEDDILKHKNFESVLSQAQSGDSPSGDPSKVKNPLKLKYWMYGGGAAIISGIIISYFLLQSNPMLNDVVLNEDSLQQTTTTIDRITPPIPELAIAFEEFVFNAEEANELLSSRNTKISIPENILSDSAGNLIKGEVVLKYREFLNVKDVFLSGIPMQYDSAGVRNFFESAGMFEMYAYQAGNKLRIKDNSSIGIELKSANTESGFNDYFFDTVNGEWQYLNPSTVVTEDASADDYAYQYQTKEEPESNAFLAPKKRREKSHAFKMEVDQLQFPELSIYEEILFEIDESKQAFDTRLYDVRWQQMDLLRNGEKAYQLKLSRTDTSVILDVIPVFEAKAYESALLAYQKNLAQKKAESRKQVTAQQERKQSNTSLNRNLASRNYSGVRSIQVTRFGISNIDKPLAVPILARLRGRKARIGADEYKLSFAKREGKADVKNIYIIRRGVNQLISLSVTERFELFRRNEYLIYAQTSDNEYCFYTSEDLRSLKKSGKKVKLKFIPVSREDLLDRINQYTI